MPFFIELLIRGAVLSAVVLLLGSVPALRRLAAHGTMVTIALVWLVALPWLVARGPRVSLGLLPAAPWLEAPPRSPFEGVVDLAASQAPVAREAPAPSLTSVDGQSVRASSHDRRPDMTATIYLIVTLALLVRRGAAAFRVHRVVRRTRFTTVPAIALRCARDAAARVGLRLTPRLCISSEVPLPFVFGLRRPVIVLSPESLTWSVARFEAVMLHEMAHVRRRDILTCGIADLACALNWFNPLVWIAAARLRSEAEVACDDAVVRSGVGAEAYARELVQLARKYRGAPFLSPAIGIVGESSLAHRVRTILTKGDDRGHVTALHVACGAFIACATALASAVITPVAVSAQSAQQVSAFNISNGGPEISSNGAGLQARWNDHGKHSAMFLSGDVDLREVASGQLRGSGRLLLIEEEGTGIKVFEWQSGQPEVLPTDVIRSLVTGAGQLERLTG
ncbi:MAG: M56 family metallopeptidase, partial [Gemmatimonadaceae bacterium]